MRHWLWMGLLLMGIAGAVPWSLKAQHFFDPCHTCQRPVAQCSCQRVRPVVQTQFREEKVTTYRDVVETRYRDECIVERTPVTTYEDRVETVLVPQQVTKRVAKTVMVPQTKSRTVPYQVMQRIPQTTTRMVPYQTVHHVTETVPMAAFETCPPGMAYGVPLPGPSLSTHPIPRSAEIEPHRAPPLSPRESKSNGWQVIQPRTSSLDRFGGYEAVDDRLVPTPFDDEPAVRKVSWHGHVPGAAAAMKYTDRPVLK